MATLTKLSLVRLPILRERNELFGEHAAAIAQDVALQLGVRIGTYKLHHNGVTGGVDADLHVLASDCGARTGWDYYC